MEKTKRVSRAEENAMLRLTPHRARRPTCCTAAWWYEGANSINIYCYDKLRGGMSCHIDRKSLEDWLKRARAARGKCRG